MLPVSYTHLDVYKRQDYSYGDTWEDYYDGYYDDYYDDYYDYAYNEWDFLIA